MSYFLVPRTEKRCRALEGDKTDALIEAIKSTKDSSGGKMLCTLILCILLFVQGFRNFHK